MIRSDTRLSQEIVPIDENCVSLCPNGDLTASVVLKRPAGAGAPGFIAAVGAADSPHSCRTGHIPAQDNL